MATAESQHVPGTSRTSFDAMRGVYDARRAAALSGVPKRTLTWWAQKGYYRPSISPEPRPRLWSWYDLVALRTIDWLRQPKRDGLKGVPIRRIREAIEEIDRRGLSRADLHNLVVQTKSGVPYLNIDQQLIRADGTGQFAMPDALAVVYPYKEGPDLLQPRPLLRIIPGKLHGEPHLLNTRISSATIYALHEDGFLLPQIHDMYPEADPEALTQAIDLEESLQPRAA
jgi:DNA-binding transcriptional MerR regulator/uncharacterized protein (DUF433 family)